MLKSLRLFLFPLVLATLILPGGRTNTSAASESVKPPENKTRLAIVGLDHDHVWGLLKEITAEPNAELVAIADSHSELVARAKAQVPASTKFYAEYVQMLDETKPDAVIVSTANDRHLAILRECAKRRIHYFTEKPMATNANDAREMERLAQGAGIKFMVNYWNAWVAPSHELVHALKSDQVGPILKGRPTRVYATAAKLKVEQHNKVDDDATIVLEYPDATAIVQASWNWPYGKGQVEVFGPKGSLIADRDALLFHSADHRGSNTGPYGEPLSLSPLPREANNPISYFLHCIRDDKPIEDPLSVRLNVQVLEILDAARESVRTGRAQELH